MSSIDERKREKQKLRHGPLLSFPLLSRLMLDASDSDRWRLVRERVKVCNIRNRGYLAKIIMSLSGIVNALAKCKASG